MAYILVGKDGSAPNAKPGDTVVTGGGLVHINNDGTKTTTPLPGIGKTGDYNTVVKVMENITKEAADYISSRAPDNSGSALVPQNTAVYDSPTNYDTFTMPAFDYDPMAAVNGTTSYNGSNLNFSNILGYGIVGLVLIVVLDKLIG